MISFEAMLSTYGYAAIVAGTLLEGETILILAGLAAHQGYLKLPWVVFYGFIGTLAGDQLYFYLGRFQGAKALDRKPYWKSRGEIVFGYLQKHRLLLTFGFRFLYGLRTITPFLLGASRVAPLYFLLVNLIGAFFWSAAIVTAGYLFGRVFKLLVGDIERYEVFLFAGLAVAGILLWGFFWLRRHRGIQK
jgi:membrane protein DedA with SNARE-associated domain